jgi:hypothetical protein
MTFGPEAADLLEDGLDPGQPILDRKARNSLEVADVPATFRRMPCELVTQCWLMKIG